MGASRLSMVILVVGIVGFVIFLIGFCSPYWTMQDRTIFGQRIKHNAGIWKSCTNGRCTTLKGRGVSDKGKAIQALECLALIASLIGVALAAFLTFKGKNKNITWATCGLFLGAGLAALIGIIIYGANVDQGLHWAFALTIIGALVFLADGILTALVAHGTIRES